jgi:hypothetical protein
MAWVGRSFLAPLRMTGVEALFPGWAPNDIQGRSVLLRNDEGGGVSFPASRFNGDQGTDGPKVVSHGASYGTAIAWGGSLAVLDGAGASLAPWGIREIE